MNNANSVKNTILAINISHDTSVAVITNGVVVDVFEEERSRRSKYYAPKGDEDTFLQVIQSKIDVDSIDEVVFTSFDRRMYDVEVDPVFPKTV
jgi:predicted NodU family carbamoyl transferase